MESINNFRDFGGYKTHDGSIVKKGLLYRSGSLMNASDDDLKRISVLGIKTIIDLRTKKEKSEHPDRIPDNSGIKLIHIPIKAKMHDESAFIYQLFSLMFGKARKINYHEAMKVVYREYVTDFRSEFSAIIRLVANNDNLPLLIHCVGGKDRTGFACSLIQMILKVPFETVIKDYLMTNDYLHEMNEEIQERLKKFSFFGISVEKFLPLIEARSDYLEAAYEQIKTDFGTVADYIRYGLNILNEDKKRMQHALLENEKR